MSINIPIVSSFSGKGFDKAIAQFKKLETTADKAEFIMRKFGAPAMTAAIGAITTELTLAVKAAAEDQKSQEQLKIALENTVGANQAQVAAVEDSITSLMYQTATADNELRPALSKLVRATGDVAKAQGLLKLGLDIAAGSGRDLTSVTTALSRAALGSFTALTRLGIPLDQAAVKAKNLDGVLGGLASSFAGAASRNAQTFEGQLKTLKIAVGELQENIGRQLLPILSDYATVLVSLTTKTAGAESSTKTWFDRLKTGIGFLLSNVPALGPAAKAIGLINDKVREQADYLKRLQQPTSNVTKRQIDLSVATNDTTAKIKDSTAATDKAAAAAKKHADALAKFKAAAEAAKKETLDLAQALRDKLAASLDVAQQKVNDAKGAFDSFADLVGKAITGAFNFGDAQSEASGNAGELKTALEKQAEAQAKVNKAQADFNYFQRDDYALILADAMGELAAATGEVTKAQAKPMTFFDALAKQAQKAKDFSVLVNRLIAAGLSETALQQVLAAGVDGGSAIATEILSSADGVLKANTLTQSMTDLADAMGKRAAAKYYGAGVDSAINFLKGIQDTIKAVEVVLAKPDLTSSDVIGAYMGQMTPADMAEFQAQLAANLQSMNFGMGTLMASGGIVTSAQTITAGESGPEAIIPLDRAGEFGLGGGGGGVTINVNGGDPNAVVAALRTYMRQNGSIPIRVSNIY